MSSVFRATPVVKAVIALTRCKTVEISRANESVSSAPNTDIFGAINHLVNELEHGAWSPTQE